MILAACSCIAFVSCSSDESSRTAASPSTSGNSPSPAPNDSEVTALLSEALPIQFLLAPSETDYALLDNAVDVLTSDCMTESGFDYEPYPPRPSRNLLDLRTRYGLLTATDAASSGYRSTIPSGDPPEYLTEVDRIDREREAEGGSYMETLYGPDGDGGCRSDASTQIWGGPTGLMSVPGYEDIVGLSVQSRELLLREDDAVAADRMWSMCMAERGYQFASWVDAQSKFLVPGSEATTAEIDQATTDVQCRESVGLERILFEAETRIQNELIDQSPLARTFEDQINAAVVRAKAYDPLN